MESRSILGAVGCVHAMIGAGLNLQELLRKNTSGYDENIDSENSVTEILQNVVSRYGFQKFADLMADHCK